MTGNISIPSLLSPINEVISFFSFLTMYNSTCEEDVKIKTLARYSVIRVKHIEPVYCILKGKITKSIQYAYSKPAQTDPI